MNANYAEISRVGNLEAEICRVDNLEADFQQVPLIHFFLKFSQCSCETSIIKIQKSVG